VSEKTGGECDAIYIAVHRWRSNSGARGGLHGQTVNRPLSSHNLLMGVPWAFVTMWCVRACVCIAGYTVRAGVSCVGIGALHVATQHGVDGRAGCERASTEIARG
jgi:hypothetical protein